MTADQVLDVARKEIGTREWPANSNRVKYNTLYYGRDVAGGSFPWCCVFLWWVFRQAGASHLFYGGQQTAYCPTLQDYHKGQRVKGNYKPGDVIFFNFSGGKNAQHVGLCESWDGKRITTIDGNTELGGSEANGGMVLRRTRDKKYIVGAYRPIYKEVNDMITQEQFDQMMDAWLERQGKLPPSAWGKMDKAAAAGITDGSRPGAFATREEVATMAMNAVVYWSDCVLKALGAKVDV